MAATTSASGRSMPASSSAASPASAIKSGRLSSRRPKRVIPTPAIPMSLTGSFQTVAGTVSNLLGRGWRPFLGGARRSAVAPASPPRAGGRRDLHLEFPHEPEEVRPLKPERPRRPRPIAAGLREGRLDEPSLELGDGSVKPVRLRTGCRRRDRGRRGHARARGKRRARKVPQANQRDAPTSRASLRPRLCRGTQRDEAPGGQFRVPTQKREPSIGAPLDATARRVPLTFGRRLDARIVLEELLVHLA